MGRSNRTLRRNAERLKNALGKDRRRLKEAAAERKAARRKAERVLSDAEYTVFVKKQDGIRIRLQREMAARKRALGEELEQNERAQDAFRKKLVDLKRERGIRSSKLQDRLFRKFVFNDANGRRKNLPEIFREFNGSVPPAGAGECCAPRLLQCAYDNGYRPLAMAEFWWGRDSVSRIRRHGRFYPACREKCEPILMHMLTGLDVDRIDRDNRPDLLPKLRIVHEDRWLLVVDKPDGLLSVPGKGDAPSVQSGLRRMFPDFPDMTPVHRLDRDTSGLLLVARTREVYIRLQRAFAGRTIKKRYSALLEGRVEGDRGRIELPLLPDTANRPQQMVSAEHGKPASTLWEVAERSGSRTLVHLFPETGRTHQLRVHAAHPAGLDAPIVGDPLYGSRADRLYLHADRLSFVHPFTGELQDFSLPLPFSLHLS